jgi:hypothetical protein
MAGLAGDSGRDDLIEGIQIPRLVDVIVVAIAGAQSPLFSNRAVERCWPMVLATPLPRVVARCVAKSKESRAAAGRRVRASSATESVPGTPPAA